MASEWALKRVREAHLCGYHCGDDSAICDCGSIAAALDEARTEALQEGRERERRECYEAATLAFAQFRGGSPAGVEQRVCEAIAARGPMRGPEEE